MISVCIPTKNAGSRIASTLGAWRRQEVGDDIELVVVDSGSSDDTPAHCRAAGARVTSIPPESFNHGHTRNRLGELARGDILVFTVQDAAPADEQVLRHLVEPLWHEPELAGVCGRQEVAPEADLVGRWETVQLGNQVGLERRYKRLASWQEFLTWDLPHRFESVCFDNVCSAIRRRVWEETPFSRIDFGEDLDWAVRVLRRGGVLLRNPAARVLHSHCRVPMEWLLRYFVGRRCTNHTLHMPAEYSSLDDAAVEKAVSRFDARVAGFIAEGWRHKVMPAVPGLLDQLVPAALRRAVRAVTVQGLRSVINWRWGTRPLLAFGRVWNQVRETNGTIPADEVSRVARQVEGLILGDFLGSYHHTCEVERRLSPRFASLGQWMELSTLNGQALGRTSADGLGPFFSVLRTAGSPPPEAPATTRGNGQ
jgi:glycosyltransferase involved in cell wall biosynthesis